jgi:serpin B
MAQLAGSTVEEPLDVAGVVQEVNKFSYRLYSKLPEGNTFASPLNVHTVLSMAFEGADGETKKQMAAVLGCENREDSLAGAYGQLLGMLNTKLGSGQLSAVNMLWGQKGYPFSDTFIDSVADNYGARLSDVDFSGDLDGAIKQINDWASTNTAGKIKDLVSDDLLDQLTRLVLTGAIYFKDKWKVEFDPKDTRKRPFHKKSGKSDVDMMHLKKEFVFAEDDTVQYLSMPYKSNQLAMDVYLPREIDGLSKVEGMLGSGFGQLLQQAHKKKVDVSFPKFEMECNLELKHPLQSLGMVNAFSTGADFSRMTKSTSPADRLHVSDVVQKSYVKVDEEGTEATAATAMVMRCLCIERDPVFVADHPFCFAIRHLETGLVLFIGRVQKP